MGVLILIIIVIVIISLVLSDPGTSSTTTTKYTPPRRFGDGASMYDFKDYVNAKADKHQKEMETKREKNFR